jgi:DNA-binding transcriptional regulator of glucitol operon
MKVKTIYKVWFYAIAALASFFLAYTQWKHGNSDAAIAWLICTGAQAGCAGVYYEIKEYQDKFGDIDDEKTRD